MNKTFYLFVVGILCFFPLECLIPILNIDVRLVLMLAWSIFGWAYYTGYENELKISNGYSYIVPLFLILYLLSSITPVFRYGQDFVLTWIAMRTDLLIIFFATLLKVMPSEENIEKSFKYLSLLAFIFIPIVLFFPHLFAQEEQVQYLLWSQKHGSTDLAVTWPGCDCVAFYFYIRLQKMIDNASWRNILSCSLLIGYIFLWQNRSTMICAIPFFLWGIYKSKFRYKQVYVILIALVCGGFIIRVLSTLFEESQKQLSDTSYNRWQAIYFFLLEQKNNLYTYLFGNGVPHRGSSYLAYMLKAQYNRLAFISDIGLLGTFFYYGLFTMILIYSFIIKGIKHLYMPRYLRYYCWWTLLIPTIHAIGLGASLADVMLFIVFYLVVYNEAKYKALQVQD